MIVYKYDQPELDLSARVYLDSIKGAFDPNAFAYSIMDMLGEKCVGKYESDRATYTVLGPVFDDGSFRVLRELKKEPDPSDISRTVKERYIPTSFIFKPVDGTDKVVIKSSTGPGVKKSSGRYPWGKQQKVTFCKPHPKHVLENFKDDTVYTTVVWQDGTHTIIKKSANDEYDQDKAIMFAVIKKMCGDNGCAMDRYFDEFRKNTMEKGD